MSDKQDLWNAVWAAERDEKTKRIRIPIDILSVLGDKRIKASTEGFYVVTLNGAHEVIRVRTVTSGLVNRTMVHAREVFRAAISDNAAAVMLAHNHPSGNLEPSAEDDEITRRLVDAGQVIGIQVLDHVIVSRAGYFSYLEQDRL
jgi:DNA repair protein RadC